MIKDPLLSARAEVPQPEPEATPKPEAKLRPRTFLLGAGAAILAIAGAKSIGESYSTHKAIDKTETAAPVKVDMRKIEHDANTEGLIGGIEFLTATAIGAAAAVDQRRSQQTVQQSPNIPIPGPR